MLFLFLNLPAKADDGGSLPAIEAGFNLTTLNEFSIRSFENPTGEKPQSKVWFYDNKWWAVLPNSSGTHVWRLDGATWSSILQIAGSNNYRADCKVAGNVVHILLVRSGNSTAQLVSVEYVPASQTYQLWSLRPATVDISVSSSIETATIDIDSQGRMWLGSDASTTIEVRYSDPPYSDWFGPLTLATNLSNRVDRDDICVITAFDNKIGILWSDQDAEEFGFRYHVDGAAPATWSAEENPPNPFGNAGNGFADDHLNLATASDGSIYAAVKTSFSTSGFPVIALLVRQPSGTWSSHAVDYGDATRPIVVLNEADDMITVAYSKDIAGDHYRIVCKQSPASGIAFGCQMDLLSGDFNDVTSAKQSFTGQIVFLASDEGRDVAGSVLASVPPLPSFADNGSGRALDFDGSNDHICGNNLALNITGQITLEAWISPASAGNRYILRKGRPGVTSGYEIGLNSSSKVYARLYQAGSGTAYTVTSVTNYPTNGSWMHAAVSYDGSAIRLYVNGVQEATLNAAIAIGANGDPLAIGAQPEGTGAFFVGRLDEVRIWNLARSQQQIREYMCRKLSGGESGLAGYWPLDEESGMVAYDQSGNNIDLVLMNMAENDHVWSGAPLGDESAFDYDSNGGYTAALSHPHGDNLSATTTSGAIQGIHVYRADADALRPDASIPANWSIDPLRFWGVFVAGSSSPQYTVVYDYDGHPGITNETDLRLAYRDNHSDDSWANVGALPNTNNNTLTGTAQPSREFALASATPDNSLPVELSSFTAASGFEKITLEWATESELNNLGFILERGPAQSGPFAEIASYLYHPELRGQGNSNQRVEYAYTDENLSNGEVYYYRLSDVDIAGVRSYYPHVISAAPRELIGEFRLHANYPNPFNPGTTIKFEVPESGSNRRKITLAIYNSLGQEVKTLYDGFIEGGAHEIYWDARDGRGNPAASGQYFVRLRGEGYVRTIRMILLR
ncbi:MAG: T9SS type A sorting domain-containing protein [Calditrichia bacterium]|nr:T9SS type A sorting domain-containing protein [Calditrichia bacterium]